MILCFTLYVDINFIFPDELFKLYFAAIIDQALGQDGQVLCSWEKKQGHSAIWTSCVVSNV